MPVFEAEGLPPRLALHEAEAGTPIPKALSILEAMAGKEEKPAPKLATLFIETRRLE